MGNVNQEVIYAQQKVHAARKELVSAIMALQRADADIFEPTIKEIKETVGDLVCAEEIFESFFDGLTDKPT